MEQQMQKSAVIAAELRIGNWVVEKFMDRNFQVQSMDNRFLGAGYGGSSLKSTYGNYEPILLTPKILVKCGFDEWSEGHWKTRKSLNKKGWSENFNFYLPYFNFSTYTGNVTIKYLHQLQNLYFALTGTELEITL